MKLSDYKLYKITLRMIEKKNEKSGKINFFSLYKQTIILKKNWKRKNAKK